MPRAFEAHAMQTLPASRQKKLIRPPQAQRSARRSLAAAFASFNQTAGALEQSYRNLQAEVSRLRSELEEKNRRLAESLEENKRVRAYLSRVVEGLPCGVLVLDSDLKLRIVNPPARQLLACGDSGSELPSGGVPSAEALAPLLEQLRDEDLSREQEWTVEGPEGVRILGVTRARLSEGESAEKGFIVILRDVTEERLLERERESAGQTRALAEMATVLAHEIRNPLGSLELFAGLLADAAEEYGDIRPWVDHVQAGLRSLAATVNNVLHFHSQSEVQLVSTNVARLLDETVDFLRPLARQRGMRIEFTASQPQIHVPADPHRLQQAFFNLALNAFRAMSSGRSLQVRVHRSSERPEEWAEIEFSDQGTGISPEHLERIFDAGFSTNLGSPGIGLAVTRKVVEQHGGTIRVRSEMGKGTTFTLTLPLQGAEA